MVAAAYLLSCLRIERDLESTMFSVSWVEVNQEVLWE